MIRCACECLCCCVSERTGQEHRLCCSFTQLVVPDLLSLSPDHVTLPIQWLCGRSDSVFNWLKPLSRVVGVSGSGNPVGVDVTRQSVTDSDRQQRPAVWLSSAQSIYTHINITQAAQLISMKRLHAIFLLSTIKNRICHCRMISKLKGDSKSENNHFKKSHTQIQILCSNRDVEWNVHGSVIYKLQKKLFQILEGREWSCAVSDVILLPEFGPTHTPFCSVCEQANDERIQCDGRSDTWHTRVTRLTADKMRATCRRESRPHDAKMDRMAAE